MIVSGNSNIISSPQIGMLVFKNLQWKLPTIVNCTLMSKLDNWSHYAVLESPILLAGCHCLPNWSWVGVFRHIILARLINMTSFLFPLPWLILGFQRPMPISGSSHVSYDIYYKLNRGKISFVIQNIFTILYSFFYNCLRLNS